ncbi:hypothetical protein J3A64_003786 [Pseudarthrobacter sp. PvP004]|nr:hypothetical protein [Pseudarthrobacter sp. PvP004]
MPWNTNRWLKAWFITLDEKLRMNLISGLTKRDDGSH